MTWSSWGGPAGAAAAKAAVEEGLATLLIEKIRLYLHKDKFVEVAEQGQSVWRDKFDQWLCKASGAEVWDRTRMLDFCEWGDCVEVVCTRERKKVRLRARALVAADGGMSQIRKRIDPGFLEGVPCITARHEYHHCDTDLEPGVFNVFMNAEYGVYPAGKGMVAARDDHRAGEACLQRGTPQPSRSRYPAIDQGHDGVAARRRCGPRHAKGRHRGPAQKAPSPELRLPILTPIAGAGCSDRTIVSDFWVGFGQGRWYDG